MKHLPSLKPHLFALLFAVIFLLASCTQQPSPQTSDSPDLPALFNDADISKAELQLAERVEALETTDAGSIAEGVTLPELSTSEGQFSAQAVLPGTTGFVFYIQKNPASTTQPLSIFRYDQRNDVNTRIYAGQREIQAVAGTVDGNTLLVSMRETTDPASDFEIFRLRISPARTQQLTSNTTSDTNVSISGNGQRVVWEQDVAGKATIMMRTYDDLDSTSNFFEVSLNRAEGQRQPAVSSDGRFIVLVRDLADGRDQVLRFDTRLSSYTSVITVSNTTILEHPTLDSSGNKILYLQRSTTGNNLARLRDLTAGTTQTVVNAPTIEHPFLATDGKRITFGLLQSGTLRVFVKDIVTGQQLRLTSPASPVSHEGMSWVMPFNGKIQLPSPSTLTSNGFFGGALAADGDTLVIGAKLEALATGAVYVYQRDASGQWLLLQRIGHPQPVGNSFFGASVAISGNLMVIGNAGGAVDLNGNGLPNAELGEFIGAVYVYQKNSLNATWNFVRRILAPQPDESHVFGSSVAISGTTVLVGAPSGTGIGSVFVFDKDLEGLDTWAPVKEFSGSDGQASDGFGDAIASSGNTVVVGASRHNNNQGAAYVFEKNQGGSNNWGEVKKLVASDGKPGDTASILVPPGLSVAISGSTIVMGVQGEARDIDGVPGNESSVGAAYIFERNSGGANNWGEVKKLVSSTPLANDFYGFSVAVQGDLITVGLPKGNVISSGNGRAFLYQRNQGGINAWGETAALIPHEIRRTLPLGIPVTLTGGSVVATDPARQLVFVFE